MVGKKVTLKEAQQRAKTEGPYSINLIFSDGSYLLVREQISEDEAYSAFQHYRCSLGAKVGTTKRVAMMIGEDVIDEWIYEGEIS